MTKLAEEAVISEPVSVRGFPVPRGKLVEERSRKRERREHRKVLTQHHADETGKFDKYFSAKPGEGD